MKRPIFSLSIFSLYGRIFAVFWLTILAVVVMIIMASHSDPRRLQDVPKEYLDKIHNHTQKVTQQYQNGGQLEKAIPHLRRSAENGLQYYFADAEGNWLQNNPRPVSKILDHFQAISEDAKTPKRRLYGQLMVLGPVPTEVADNSVNMYITVKWRRPPPILLQLLDRPWQMLIAIMIVSTPLLLWLSWAISQPARRLENAAKKVARGQFEVDPNLEKGSREFKQAGESFNQMVLAINNMMQGQQRLLSDISHELRSPLTRLRMANALAMRKQGQSAELTRIETETERLENMINALLDLSRNQANSHEVRQHIAAADIWEEMLKDAMFEAEQVEKKVTTNALPNCYLTCTPYLLTSALENVIRNAIKYCQQQVWVSFALQGQKLHILVEDDGNGVDKNELEAIFRPFYRVGEARDRDTGGAGLGLAITQSVMEQHNGEINARMSEKGGLAIELILPVENTRHH